MPRTFPAADASSIRELLPTDLGSAELRDAIAADMRARSVFVSRCTSAIYLYKVKEVIDAITAGDMDFATGRLAILQTARAIGYTPEIGFPDAMGAVEPAIKGSLQDLTSFQRLNLIISTQTALMRGRGQQITGMSPARLKQFPAWELVRVGTSREPRRWGGKYLGTPANKIDFRPRWTIAGGTLYEGRMIALKGDPIWGELGSSENFEDALDTDYPPFAFNSGMGWREVSASECKALGVTGPDGESIADWLQKEKLTLLDTHAGLPAPQISMKGVDPALINWLEKKEGITLVEDTATTPGNAAEVLQRIRARRAAAEQRIKDLGEQAVKKACAAYATKGGGA